MITFFPIIEQTFDQIYNCNIAHSVEWHIERDSGSFDRWIRVTNNATTPPAQGWKLHVSADEQSAEAVLRRTLPVLLAEAASFKVAASMRVLAELNRGDGGASQIGKFITIYPTGDAHAVHLAGALAE